MNLTKFNLRSWKELYKFLFIFFLRTKIGIIIALASPLMFMILYFAISNFNNDSETFSENLGFYITLTIIPLSLITIPQVMVELKNSVLLRKIKISGYSKQNILLSFFILYFFLTIIFVIFIFIVFICFLSTKNEFSSLLSSLKWGDIFFSMFVLKVTSIIFGILLGSLLKNLLISQVVGIIIFLLTMSLAGMFIPLELISNVTFIKILSLLSPLNYPTNLLINSIKQTDQGTLNAIQDVINNAKENPESFASLQEIFSNLGLNIQDKEVINIIKNGSSIFKPNYSFYFFFQLGEIGELIGFEPIDGTKIFASWQKWLNLLMPFIISSIFAQMSLKYFSWFGR